MNSGSDFPQSQRQGTTQAGADSWHPQAWGTGGRHPETGQREGPDRAGLGTEHGLGKGAARARRAGGRASEPARDLQPPGLRPF